MDPYRELAEAQDDAEDAMRENCKVSRPTGEYSTDPATGIDVPVLEPVPVKGICRVKRTGVAARDEEAAGHEFTIGRPVVVLPLSDSVKPGDLVEITTPESIRTETLSAIRTGTIFQLVAPERASFVTAQRWSAEEMIS